MGRLITFAMLVSFAAQQFACCCTGGCASVFHGDHSPQAICETTDFAHCDCGHDDHEADGLAETGHPDDKDHPADGHQHHVCVGTHLFYVTVERFDVSRLVVIQEFDWCWSEDFVGLWSIIESSANRDRRGSISLPSAGPERSVLCVYQI